MFTNIQQIYKFLKQNKDLIIQDSTNNKTAKQIINIYIMHQSAPSDPGAQGILMSLCDAYKKEKSI